VPCHVTVRSSIVAVLGVAAALLAFALSAAPADAAATLGKRTLARGARGADVKQFQRLLHRAGFASKADGVFGRGTYRALRRLERELGLRVDGRFSSRDLRKVRAALRPAEGTGGYSTEDMSRPRAVSAQEAPGSKAQLTEDGLAIPPAGAPEAVKQIIAAGNEIASKPYRYGGGHGSWEDTGYDCSGSVSYALHGAGLLKSAMPSGGFTDWGEAGEGEWVTLYTNSGHIYMVVAGLRFDTSGRADTGSRWQKSPRSSDGFVVRHPEGL
jgi:cell wall-associated NlpC family hydrolase